MFQNNKKKIHKKDFKRLTKRTKQKKKTLKNSTKPSRSGGPKGWPAENGILFALLASKTKVLPAYGLSFLALEIVIVLFLTHFGKYSVYD